jgi:Ca-activated chloride channel homolog
MKTRKTTLVIFLAGFLIITACGGNNQGSSANNSYSNEDYTYVTTEESVDDEGYYMTEDEFPYDSENEVQNNTESYDYRPENDFLSSTDNPLSTFSIDVDNASYTNTRRFIEDGMKPPVDAVRSEELINYFDYDYPVPAKDETFSVYTEVGECPWNTENRLVHIGLKGYTVEIEDLEASNLVFLLDVSGSMEDVNKLPLLKKSFKLLVDRLNEKDQVAIVTYAGDDRVVLESTSCRYKDKIKLAIDNLESGGSTNGAGGIEKAYEIATSNFLKKGNNRIILATDGDFNIGKSSDGDVTRLIEDKRDQGVFLTILGFGMGNYKDSKMESLADHGNGNYFYIDDIRESNRVLVNNLAGTLFTIAKDVKIQVEFNPELVSDYRLIGYENRLMESEDFDNDQKDAGELGAGHSVTAIYEIVPGKAKDSNLKYQSNKTIKSKELVWVKLRYKKPEDTKSKLIEMPITDANLSWNENSDIFKFSTAVAAYSLILRESKYISNFSLEDVSAIVREVISLDDLDRVQFLQMVESTILISEAS